MKADQQKHTQGQLQQVIYWQGLVVYSFFVCNELSSATWVLGTHKTFKGIFYFSLQTKNEYTTNIHYVLP